MRRNMVLILEIKKIILKLLDFKNNDVISRNELYEFLEELESKYENNSRWMLWIWNRRDERISIFD